MGVQVVAPRELNVLTVKKTLPGGAVLVASFSARRCGHPPAAGKQALGWRGCERAVGAGRTGAGQLWAEAEPGQDAREAGDGRWCDRAGRQGRVQGDVHDADRVRRHPARQDRGHGGQDAADGAGGGARHAHEAQLEVGEGIAAARLDDKQQQQQQQFVLSRAPQEAPLPAARPRIRRAPALAPLSGTAARACRRAQPCGSPSCCGASSPSGCLCSRGWRLHRTGTCCSARRRAPACRRGRCRRVAKARERRAARGTGARQRGEVPHDGGVNAADFLGTPARVRRASLAHAHMQVTSHACDGRVRGSAARWGERARLAGCVPAHPR